MVYYPRDARLARVGYYVCPYVRRVCLCLSVGVLSTTYKRINVVFGTWLHFTRPTLCFNEIQVSTKNKVGLTVGLAPRSPCVHRQISGVFHLQARDLRNG